jgi:hypothetical protein
MRVNSQIFFETIHFLKELNYDHIMVCLRLIKNIINHINMILSSWKTSLRLKVYLNVDKTTQRSLLSLSKISFTQEMGWLRCMDEYGRLK